MANFKNVFSAKQTDFHVVLGPPGTGKTTLVEEVVQSSKCLFNPIFIGGRRFDTPQQIYDSIYSEFNMFFNKYKTLLFGGKSSFDYASFNFRYGLYDKYKEKTSDDIRKLLKKISAHLPN